MIKLLLVFLVFVFFVFLMVFLLIRNIGMMWGGDFEEDETEKVSILQEIIRSIQYYSKSMLYKLRNTIGCPPKAEAARRRAQRKKAGV